MMRNRSIAVGATAVAAALLFAVWAAAGEEPEKQQQMPPEMEAWMKYAAPGEHHAHLQKMVGRWKAESTFWTEPGAPPVKSQGTAEIRSILGGRFIQTEYEGEFMGSEFTGLGIDGFDNMKQKHVGVWIDSVGTLIMVFEGTCEDGGRVVTTVGPYTDPMTGVRKEMKTVVTMVDDDRYTYVGYDRDPDGNETKTMEVTYTRL